MIPSPADADMVCADAVLVPIATLFQKRPPLSFHDAGHGATWIIDRKVLSDGRYRWTARLHFDGVGRAGRRAALAEHAAAIADVPAPSWPRPRSRQVDRPWA